MEHFFNGVPVVIFFIRTRDYYFHRIITSFTRTVVYLFVFSIFSGIKHGLSFDWPFEVIGYCS